MNETMNPYTPYGNEPEENNAGDFSENQTDFFATEKRSFKDTYNVAVATGQHQFYVKNIDIEDFEGSQKIPPCEKAHVMLNVVLEDGKCTPCYTDLFLCDQGAWKVCAFLKSIHVMKPGEEVIPTWDAYIGASGWAQFEPYTYTSRDGDERKINCVKRFITKYS